MVSFFSFIFFIVLNIAVSLSRGEDKCKEGDGTLSENTGLKCINGTWVAESCVIMDGPSVKEGEIIRLGDELLQCQKADDSQHLKLMPYLGTTLHPITEATGPCPLCANKDCVTDDGKRVKEGEVTVVGSQLMKCVKSTNKMTLVPLPPGHTHKGRK